MSLRALTVWQPWASSIILGGKPWEFRRWPAPPRVVGQRIVVHAAKRPVDYDTRLEFQNQGLGTQAHILSRPIFEQVYQHIDRLPMAAGLGTVHLGPPVRCVDLWPGDPDVDPDMWAWPMIDPQPFAQPIPCRGMQGFWRWPEAGLEG